ncbi:MAG: hypothetical protein WA622_14610 [Mycobacterium sp.]|uniref:hypothetical protein n=1 Tax=Mycobacterium sp. TaxID=1785 RepID=UPI003BB4F7DD
MYATYVRESLRRLEVRFGRILEELFARLRGDALRRRILEMPNPEYQRLLRCNAEGLLVRLPKDGPTPERSVN